MSKNKSFRKENKAKKKIYASSTNFPASILRLEHENPLLNDIIGKLAETYVFNRLKERFEYIGFIRDGQNEIDFVCGKKTHKKKEDLFYIEVKYKDTIRDSELKYLINYLINQKNSTGIVLTKNSFNIKQYNNIKLIFLPIFCI